MIWLIASMNIEARTGTLETTVNGQTVTIPVSVPAGESWGWMPEEGHPLEEAAIDAIDFESWDMFGPPPVGTKVGPIE